jgi:hypothetical protein
MSHDTESTSRKRKYNSVRSSRLQFMQGLGGLASYTLQVFQNFSNVPILHYLQAVLFHKN